VPDRPHIVIPAAVRHRCGLRTGDRVLLAALPAEDTLAACSFAVVDQAIRAHGGFPRGEGGRPDNRAPRRAAGHVPAGGRRCGAGAAGADEAGMLLAESNQVRRPDREQVLPGLQGRGDRLLS